MKRVLGPVLGVSGMLTLQGCPPAADGDAFAGLRDPEVTITDEGSGPENAAPLEPLRVGTWAESAAGAHRVLGPQAAGDAAIHYVEVVANSRGTGSADPTVGVLRRQDDDVVIHRLGAPLDANRAAGLLIPGTVREGMRFESALDDGDAFGMTVLGREEQQGPLGPMVVWGLQEDLGDATGKVHRFAEGLGAAALAFAGDSGTDIERVDTWVVPENDQRFESLALSPDPVRPLVDDFGRSVSMMRSVSSNCRLIGAEFQWTSMVDGVPFLLGAQAIKCDDLPAEHLQFCFPLGRDGDVVVAASRCQSLLSEVLAETDEFGQFPGFRPEAFLRATRDLPRSAVHAWREDGKLRHLVDVPDPGNLTGRRRLELHRDGEALGATLVDVVTDAALIRGLRSDSWSLTRQGDLLSPLATFGPWEIAAGAPVVFGLVQRDGRVYEARLEGTRLTSWRFVGLLPGVVSLTDTAEGAIAVGVTSDLRLHRARVVGEHVVVEALGDLPPITAATDRVSASLDPTDPGRVYVNVVRPEGTRVEPEVLNARIFVADLARAPLEVTAPPTLGLGFGDWFGDIVVCWPPTGERPDTAGWTLRGAPAEVRVFAANEACALLRNDAPVDAAWVGAERAMALDLPGIGPVRVGYPQGTAWDFGAPLQGRVAPTADGGVVDIAGLRLDAQGYPIERTPTGMAAGTIVSRVHRDLSGDGFYAEPNSGGLQAIGSRTRIPTEPGWSYIAGVTSGGVILDDGTQWQRFDPGGITPVPTVQRDAVIGLLPRAASLPPHVTALDDGRICMGITPLVACVAEDGTVARATDAFIPATDSGNGAVLWPLPGGDLLVLGTNGSVRRVDPDTMVVTPYVDGQLRQLLTTADGRVLGIHVTSDGSTQTFVDVTDAGIVEVSTGPIDDVVPLDDALLVRGTDGVWRRVWN